MRNRAGTAWFRPGPGTEVNVVTGHVDAEAARQLERDLREPSLRGERLVVVDISGVEDLSPALVGALLRASRSLGWRNGRLAVVATEPMREHFELMGLEETLELVDAEGLEAELLATVAGR